MQPKSILVYGCGDVMGDGLRKLSFWQALKAAFPQTRITYLSEGGTVYQSALALLIGNAIDEYIIHGRPTAKYDLVIDTQRNFLRTLKLKLQTHPAKFLSLTAGGLFSAVKPPATLPAHVVAQLFVLLAMAAGRAVEPVAVTIPAAYNQQAFLPDGAQYVAFAPGAGGRNKCWPLENFIEAARTLKNKTPVFILGPAEKDWQSTVRDALPAAIIVTPSDPLQTIALASRCMLGVSNDSGTGHMLALAGIPLISLFGPTNAKKHAPYARKLTIIRAQDFGGDTMDLIPVGAVIDAMNNQGA